MTRVAWIAACALLTALPGCRRATTEAQTGAAPETVRVTTAPVVQQTLSQTLRVTGSLVAEQEAEVAAETSGRVIATPVERGTRVSEGAMLIALSKTEAEAQAAEAAANVAQLEARLALPPGEPFDAEKVAEVAAARAGRDLAEAEFGRIKNLLDERVVSQAEYDQRRMQLEAARSQYAAARNGAGQQFRMLEAARARASMARKALGDTDVRAPFGGVVVERKVGIGDFVTRGTEVVTIMRVSPLRLELTVPEQSVGLVSKGASVRLWVDAYPGRQFEGEIRFVAPSLRADQRALTVEAVVPNADGALKPGMFASAELGLAARQPALVVPSDAVQTIEGISRVFVIRDGVAEQRMVATGMVADGLTEIVKGVAEGEQVATGNLGSLTDGLRVTATPGPPPAARTP